MNKKLLNILKLAFFLGLGIFLVWYSIFQLDKSELDKFYLSLKTAKYWMILPVFGILTLSHITRALRWKLLIEPLGHQPRTANCFFAVMIGYLANFAFPRLGEVLKCTILAKYEGVPADKNVGTIVSERAVDVVCLLIVFALAFILEKDIVIAAYHKMQDLAKPQQQGSATWVIVFKWIVFAGIILFVLWSIVTKKWKQYFAKVKQIAKGIFEGVSSAWRLKQKGLFIAYSILIWLCYIGGTWLGLYATQGSEVGFGAAVACLSFASIGMIITPGGIGSYAILLALVLEFYNVPKSIGLANGTLQWFAQFGLTLLVGFFSLIMIPIYNRKKQEA